MRENVPKFYTSETVIIPINYIERKPNSQKYRIVGKGITVEFLAGFINDSDWSVERICQHYNLTPAEVHAAWAFYYDHKVEIDEHIAAEAVNDSNTSNKKATLLHRYKERTGREYAFLI